MKYLKILSILLLSLEKIENFPVKVGGNVYGSSKVILFVV